MNFIDVKSTRQTIRICDFLSLAGSSLKTFGYYTKRDLSAVDNHLITLIGADDTGAPIAYGHLDRDGDTVWLGICVVEGETGRGYGDEMLSALLNYADAVELPVVTLGVHATNMTAIRLYSRCGFQMCGKIAGRSDLFRMTRRIKVADTIGSLIDKLATINNKLFVSQDVLYEIRRMSFENFREHYIDNADGAKKLWEILKKTCDLNFQRSALVTEVDEKIVEMVKGAIGGKDIEGNGVQRQHKTY